MRFRHATAILTAGLGIGVAGAGVAAEPDGWAFEVTPYLWAAGMDGTIGVRGVTADVDASFSDIWDNLDAGFMALFEARKGPWTLGLEGVYIKLDDEGSRTVTGPFGQVSVTGALDVSASMTILQGSIGYRVMDTTTKVDLVGALRYVDLDVDMDVRIATDPGIVFPGGDASASGSANWTDVVVGLRVIQPISEDWSLVGYADVGGGGSDLTYQVIAGANWTLGDRFTAKAGWRYLYWDYESGGKVWDVSASGPYLGLGIAF